MKKLYNLLQASNPSNISSSISSNPSGEEGISSSKFVEELTIPVATSKKENRKLEQLKHETDFDNKLSELTNILKLDFEELQVSDSSDKERYTLDGKIFKPQNTSPDYFVIHCRGNGEFYEMVHKQIIDDVVDLECGAIGFNYPGGGDSVQHQDKVTTRELVDSVKDVVKYIMEQYNIESDHIVLKGHSIGGAIATLAAKELHDQAKPVYLFNGRSFANMSEEGAALIKAGALSGLFKLVYHSIGLQMCPGDAYKSIPDNYKTFVNVENDDVIKDSASMYTTIKNDLETQKAKTNDASAKAHYDQQINELYQHHLLQGPLPNRNHIVFLSQLKDRQNQNSGKQIFQEFFENKVKANTYIEELNQQDHSQQQDSQELDEDHSSLTTNGFFGQISEYVSNLFESSISNPSNNI